MSLCLCGNTLSTKVSPWALLEESQLLLFVAQLGAIFIEVALCNHQKFKKIQFHTRFSFR